MLRRMSLTGDAMAHAILPGAAVGFLIAGLSLSAMTIGGMAAGMAVALAAGFVNRTTVQAEDASLAAFYLISLAAGVLIGSVRGSNGDLMHVLFGAVLALNDGAIRLMAGIATVSMATMALIYRPLVLECLDPSFLRSVSRTSSPTHYAFLALAVLNLVGGFHALGIMILPAAAARFWTERVAAMIGVAVLIAVASSTAGLLVSYHWSLPSGPAIILMAGASYVVSFGLGPVGSLAVRYRPRVHPEG